jgi:hypothetical protein
MSQDTLTQSTVSLTEMALNLAPGNRIFPDQSAPPMSSDLMHLAEAVVGNAENELHRETDAALRHGNETLHQAMYLGARAAQSLTESVVHTTVRVLEEVPKTTTVAVACPDISFRLIRRWIEQDRKSVV